MQWSAVTVCDIVIAVWLVAAVFRGAVNGLILQLGRIAAWIVAYILAQIIATVVGSYFGLTFLVSYLVLSAVFRLGLQALKLVDRIPVIGFVNHVGGAICGFLLSFLLIYLLVNLVFGVIPQEMLDGVGFTREAVEHSALLSAFVP